MDGSNRLERPDPNAAARRFVRFGPFTVDLRTRELYKGPTRVRVPAQSLHILEALVREPGELVTRDALRRRLWSEGEDTFVDFEQSLNAAVRRLRDALGDSADTPRYIETLPRRGYRFIAALMPDEPAPLEASEPSPIPDAPPLPATAKLRPRRRGWLIAAALVLAVLAVTVAVRRWRAHEARVTWARTAAPLDVSRLIDEQDYEAAYRRALEAGAVDPTNPLLRRVLESASRAVSITTRPAGALVEVKGYRTGSAGWLTLGLTPLSEVRVPTGLLRLRVTHAGYEPLEIATHWGRPFDYELVREGTAPPGMVQVMAAAGAPGSVATGAFWIDRFEVTNRAFKAFVDAGGYTNRTLWTEVFERDGKAVPWDAAMASFVDRTGRPAPATWEYGSYPNGEGDHPVTGVSWYEAAAYARFAGKTLPTAAHWRAAAGLPLLFSDIITVSNVSGTGLTPVGRHRGLSASGTFDMAGNAKEWCWNKAHGGRLVLGGAWNEEPHMFAMPEAVSPFERQATLGFRCMRQAGDDERRLRDPVQVPAPRAAPGVSDETFAVYRRLFTFDHPPAAIRIDSVDDSQPFWRLESLSYVGPDGERMPALLFLPRATPPPYQVIVYYPGADASWLRNRRDMSLNWIEPLVRGGRAVLHPIYSGTFERARPAPGPLAFRDTVIAGGREVLRAIDVVEARPDLDRSRVAFVGVSDGAMQGLIAGALEPRLRTVVLLGAGVPGHASPPEIEPLVYAPRVRLPVLMVNGRSDFVLPYETSQVPLFELLGAPARDKRHAVFPGGHVPLRRQDLVREVLAWLDARLAPIGRGPVSGR